MVGDIFGHATTFRNMAIKSIAHGIVQGATEVANGGKFEHGFLAGAFTTASIPFLDGIHSVAGKVVASAMVGGTASVLGGGKFSNGAVSGAFIMLFNELGNKTPPTTTAVKALNLEETPAARLSKMNNLCNTIGVAQTAISIGCRLEGGNIMAALAIAGHPEASAIVFGGCVLNEAIFWPCVGVSIANNLNTRSISGLGQNAATVILNKTLPGSPITDTWNLGYSVRSFPKSNNK
jgi:hypothetical protein